jgi:phosphatidylinositol glycan class X
MVLYFVLQNICFIGETDVELSMEKAGDQNVTACTALNHKKIQSWFTLSIPIHQRYQYARETGGYANTTLPMPRLLLGCREKIKEYRVSKLNLCKPCINQTTKWREIPYFLMNEYDYIWEIPLGNTSISRSVIFVTLSVTIIAAIIIGYTMQTNHYHKKQD